MSHKKDDLMNKIKMLISGVLIFIMALPLSPAMAALSSEVPEQAYYGTDNASTMLNNLDYLDVKNSNAWSKEAIYEAGALGIMKGYGDRQFGRTNAISKEQAIATAYRIAGREADAQKAAEELDNAREQGGKKTDAISMWSDGYLQLAADEGLISQQDLEDAFTGTPNTLTASSFRRAAPAERQEMAYWIAKTLGLEPVYGQQKIFNNYNDWKLADPIKVPYIEAILQNSIMNGDGNGYFNATQTITREQVAQIIKNAENIVLPIMQYDKKAGTIESIKSARDYSNGIGITRNTLNIRNINGKLHHIIVEIPDNPTGTNKNEQNGTLLPANEKDLVVYKDGKIGKSSLLSAGDRIEYIAANDKTIKFIRTISNVYNTRYIVARVNSVDTSKLLINVSKYFKLDNPDINMSKDYVSFELGNESAVETYRYSNNVTVDNKKADIGSLDSGTDVILTIVDNMVTEIKTLVLRENDMEESFIQGIVEDNNPQLGYITLYNEDGSGVSPQLQPQLILHRTFNYTNANDFTIYKNHKKANIEDVEAGDTVFIKTDVNGNIIAISAVDNYTVKYARVLSKRPSSLVVEYDNGTQQVLDIDDSVLVVCNGKVVGYTSLKDGDRVKLLLHITNKFTKVKDIIIEGSENFITNIYKGTVSHIDDTSNKIVVLNLEVLSKGQWLRTEQKGFTSIKLANEKSIYSKDSKIDISRVNKYLKDNMAYIAVKKDYGGEELAFIVSFRDQGDAEAPPYDDSILQSRPASGEFSLSKENNAFKYNSGTIIVKDGRVVTGSSISNEDMAYVVANRSNSDGQYYAGVVQISDRSDANFVQIYRGRIKKINENKDFTIESFSQLNGLTWDYHNTPKTFNITYETKIIGDDGIIGQRDFVGYGASSFINSVVYILADGANAVLISTAPYGSYNIKGEILGVTGAIMGEEGTILEEPTRFSMRNVKTYDISKHLWVESKDVSINILNNSIIIKDNDIVKPSKLKKGDKVRVIKRDSNTTGDGYIIIVEN